MLPSIALPRGGGALRGIGERFSTNPATGTGSLTIPVVTSPGRAGFDLALALTYDSGAGNGPFGIGWRLGTTSVTRRTEKGLPRYGDSDVFVLSGAEDLVPAFITTGNSSRPDSFERNGHRVERYRPRTEGLFARVERWTNLATGETHWRATSRENVLSVYGRSAAARIADPARPDRVFSWLLEETRDDRGNIARYTYKPEDSSGVERSKASESNRFEDQPGSPAFLATAQRYLKRIEYGNRVPVMDRDAAAPPSDDPLGPASGANWLFEVVLDYGEHHESHPTPAEERPWLVRADPFSSFRSTFELRTYRLCRRVLMFHRFAELGAAPALVRSTDFTYDEGPVVSYLQSATQAGYKPNASGGYERAFLPPVEFGYVKPEVRDELRTLERASLEGVPGGIDGADAQWVDLDGEGISGVLIPTERAWFYKPNLGDGRLGPPGRERQLPSPAELRGGVQQLSDLGADGKLDLVSYAPPLSGYFERTDDRSWSPFAGLRDVPNLDWRDPNLRFVDLDGDGQADVLITEHDTFVWYRARGRDGFEPAAFVPKARDELAGAAIVFADGTETIHLADMSGDGLIDLVRIRNGEVSYWPNLGYGRFGRKVTLARCPQFDAPEQFDPRRVRLADIDGSGAADVIYLGRDGVRLYFNESGNSLAPAVRLSSVPPVDRASRLSVVDLLGQGTACLVLSRPLPQGSVVFSEILGWRRADGSIEHGKKPHLLERVSNNLGGETRITYASSTKFYLQDKAAGRPWLTRLAFPVQVIERVEHIDAVAKTKLVRRFAYHHGYFDGREREFRGFGRTEQWDAESFSGETGKGLSEAEFDLPPVRTVSWFHTGAWLEGDRLERAFAREYYGRDPSTQDPRASDFLLPDTVFANELDAAGQPERWSPEDEREAARALRGQTLRQEVYAEDGSEGAEHPYTVTERNYQVRRLQPADAERPGVFFTHPLSTLNLHYERGRFDTASGRWSNDDPRVQHELVLAVDAFGNPTRTATVAYPRRVPLEPEQARLWATWSERTFANCATEADWYRVGVPVESTTSELTGLVSPARGSLAAADLLRAASSASQRRVTQRERRLYCREYADVDGFRRDVQGPLPPGVIERRALPHQTLRQAFASGFIGEVHGARVTDAMLRDEGHYVLDDGVWWVASGRAVFDPARFFLPVEAVDPFGAWTAIEYDAHALLVAAAKEPRVEGEAFSGQVESTDTRFGGITRVSHDYRVLAPAQLTDPNQNRTAVEFDALGMVIKTAVLGKVGAGEGDTLADPTTRIEYDLHRWRTAGRPAFVRTLVRERHGSANPRWQEAYSYSDGSGHEVLKKIQAEPGPVPTFGPDGRLLRRADGSPQLRNEPARWVGTGRAVFDNKGNAIKKYEPFFSSSPDYEDEKDLAEWGVTPIYRYDPLGRLIRTDHPNGTTSSVSFGSWSQQSWDENDAITGTPWLAARQGLPPTDPERRAADLTLAHAGTPAVVHLDALSRVFLAVVDDGTRQHQTRFELDLEGNQRSITDARGNQTVTQTFDMLGRKAHVTTADAGTASTLLDVGNKTVRAWDGRGVAVRRAHDALQRPTHLFVSAAGGPETLSERTLYGEQHPQAAQLNSRGQVQLAFDGSGLSSAVRFDFKGNPLERSRRLGLDRRAAPDWGPLAQLHEPTAIAAAAAGLLEAQSFTTLSAFDALNRVVSHTTPDGSESRYGFNEANLLERVEVRLRGAPTWTTVVEGIDYNARGQRERIEYANGTTTSYSYDELTYRLVRQQTLRASDGRVLQDHEYTYDPVGNVLELRDRANWVEVVAREPVSPDGRYRYDALYRLVEAEGREHPGQQPTDAELQRTPLPHPNDVQALRRYVEQYSYDETGNITEVAHQAGTERWRRRYTHSTTGNRLLTTSAPSDPPGGPWTDGYDYDPQGNLTRMPHLQALRWDFADRLESVTRGTSEVFFASDGGGQRVRKVHEHGGLIEERIYLGGFELYRKWRAGAAQPDVERETLHVMDSHRRVTLIETKTRDVADPTATVTTRHRYQLDNHLGSVGAELDSSGALVSYEEYFPFGATSFHAVRAGLEASPKRYRYTGMERDEETGLSFHGARYYAPWLGRWTSPDPAGLVDGTNVYAYVRNNPLSQSDPTGLWGWREVAVVAAVVVVGTIVTVATAGAAAPLIAGAVATIGLSGGAATIATGVAVGAVAGFVGGAAAGAAGEGTRQAVHGESLDLQKIGSASWSGAKEGALIGGAIGGVAAAATTAAGAAVIGGAGRLAQRVLPAAVQRGGAALGRGLVAAAKAVTRAPGIRQGAQALQALERGAQQLGLRAARGLFGAGSKGAAAASNAVGGAYASSGAPSSGPAQSEEEILKRFHASKHTPTSEAVSKGIQSGELNVQFKLLDKRGTSSGGGDITINSSMNVDDILSTIVHEGRHELDIAAGLVPPPGVANTFETALAEVRAFAAEGRFAQLNDLTNSVAHYHGSLAPERLAESVLSSYRLKISDPEFVRIMGMSFE